MKQARPVTLIYGDGVGREVIQATRQIIDATGVFIQWEECEAGAEVFKKGLPSGVPAETIHSITQTRCVLKGPLETPVGFGEKSANVTLRKLFETFANIRPIHSFPRVPTPFQGRLIDFVVVRENVEDLYAGIEYMQTPDVAQALKLITRKGCEKIVRVAFELARSEGRRRVQCATKANILKFSEGMLKRTFEEIALEYPEIEASHIIVDNCAHQMVRFPEKFDVIVTTNMNGDILSDLGSGLVGGLGFAPSANLGNDIAIFEAVHGSAPKYAGRNVINPSAALLSGVMLLRYLGEFEAAHLIEQALRVTLEKGVFTRDIQGDEGSVSTTLFTQAIINHFGQKPQSSSPRLYQKVHFPPLVKQMPLRSNVDRKTVGIDIFIEAQARPEHLGSHLSECIRPTPFYLKNISNRGIQVYPITEAHPDLVDHWACRFLLKAPDSFRTPQEISQKVGELLYAISQTYSWMHLELLNVFGHSNGFMKAQGED